MTPLLVGQQDLRTAAHDDGADGGNEHDGARNSAPTSFTPCWL